MDDELSFDFEAHPEYAAQADAPTQAGGPPAFQTRGMPGGGAGVPLQIPTNRKNFRQTVCRHWLRGLCMKGEACGFLHQFDPSRMPVCRFFAKYGECRETDCVFKHSSDDIKDCNMYKLGFCIHGSSCRYRHVKLPGPPPHPSKAPMPRSGGGGYFTPGDDGPGGGRGRGRGRGFGDRRELEWGGRGGRGFGDQRALPGGFGGGGRGGGGYDHGGPIGSMQQQQLGGPPPGQPPPPHHQPPPPQQQQQQQPPPHHQPPPPQHQQGGGGGGGGGGPPQGPCRYFMIKSSNASTLEAGVRQGAWATQAQNEERLNGAFGSVDTVVLVFSVNESGGFQGCARMTSMVGDPSAVAGAGGQGRNFNIEWLKLCTLTFDKIANLRNPMNEDKPVKMTRDGQEIDPSVGSLLLESMWGEPDSCPGRARPHDGE